MANEPKADHARGHSVPGNIARDGAPKQVQTDAPVHSGMRHVATADDGSKVHAKNVSRTQAQRLLGTDGGLGTVNDGGQPKPHGVTHELDNAVKSGSHVSSADQPKK